MNYLKYYKLEVEPCRNDPDQRFYYESEAQRQSRLRLLRGIYQRKGLMLVTGGSGLGKTTLSHYLCQNLPQERWAPHLFIVPHAACATGWLLPQIAHAVGVAAAQADPMLTLTRIAERFCALLGSGRHPVLLIDEAQLLSTQDALQEVRGLLNLRYGGQRCVSIVLLGPPSLDGALAQDASLAQRVDIRVQLSALSGEETAAYLAHRLTRAGAEPGLFTEEALTALYEYTRGVPRLINTLADNALFEGFLGQIPRIDASLVGAAAEQLGLVTSARDSQPAPAPAWVAAAPVASAVANFAVAPPAGPSPGGPSPGRPPGLATPAFTAPPGPPPEPLGSPPVTPDPSAEPASLEVSPTGRPASARPETDANAASASADLALHIRGTAPSPTPASPTPNEPLEEEPLEILLEVEGEEEPGDEEAAVPEETDDLDGHFDSLFAEMQGEDPSVPASQAPAASPQPASAPRVSDPAPGPDPDADLDALFDEIRVSG
ncbi:MAG: ExeA family protein [Myxococcota bacterium]